MPKYHENGYQSAKRARFARLCSYYETNSSVSRILYGIAKKYHIQYIATEKMISGDGYMAAAVQQGFDNYPKDKFFYHNLQPIDSKPYYLEHGMLTKEAAFKKHNYY